MPEVLDHPQPPAVAVAPRPRPPLHSLLERQLRRHLGAGQDLPLGFEALLAAVGEAYHQADQDRKMLERALDVSSEELLEANSGLSRSLALLQEASAERERAAVAIRESEQRFRALVDQAADAMFVHDLVDGRLLDVNQRACDSLGYSRGDLLARSVSDFVVDVDTAQARAFWSEMRAGRPETVLAQHRRKDGITFPIEARLGLIEYGGSTVVLALCRDISAAEAALRESEAKYRDLFDYAPVGYHELDAEGRITSVNRTELTMLGYEAAEMLGRYVWELAGNEISGERLRTDRTRTAPRSPYAAEMRRKDGSMLPVLIEESLLGDSDGTVRGTRATLRDATACHVLEAQLRQAAKMEAVGRLAGGVAHDFNNLLTAILGYSELALREIGPAGALRRDLEEIHKAGVRAGSLTAQLLAFSRKQLLQPHILDLNEVVADMERMLRRVIGEDIELRTVTASGLGPVRADRGQLEQVVLNLAVNARDAMPEGGSLVLETTTVAIGSGGAGRPAGHYAVLAVADDGCGMDEEVKSHIFEPFYTTKELGLGTGLGLATVYGIVRQSGGWIEVDSTIGRGTTFRIFLPTVDAETADVADELTGEVGAGSGTVLVVEDDPAVRRLACAVLAGAGYQVLEASGPEEARDLASGFAGPIDLLLTDVVMPGGGGSRLAQDLGRLRPATRTLFVSGYSDGELSRRGELLPGIELLQKPFGPDELRRKVQQILNQPPFAAARLSGEAA